MVDMKKIKILLIAVLLIIAGAFFNNTYAANNTAISLKAETTRSGKEYRYYVTGEGNTDVYYSVVKIYDTNDNTKSIYCLRGNRGFGATSNSDISESSVNYIGNLNMHDSASPVIQKYKDLYGVNLNVSKEMKNSAGVEKSVNIYNAILWILDEAYLPKDKKDKGYSASEYKEELLDKAGVTSSEKERKNITDDDIEVIQQLAIWYFANYDEQNKKPTVSQVELNPTNMLRINDINTKIEDYARRRNLNKIYQYFIYGAIDNSSIYRRYKRYRKK